MVSRTFVHSVSANLAYWRRRAMATDTEGLAALHKERHNLYRAIEAGLALDTTWRPAAELSLALRTLFEHYGYHQEWIDLLTRVLDRCPESDRILKARLIYELGLFLRLERRLDQARQRMNQALSLLDGDQPTMEAGMHHGLSTTYYHLRQYDLAEEHGRRALSIFQENP
ncbi:MAG: hypothetical protein R3300_16085, partial [Candidatus Promineifilaceae bacterium]|nr:hypothetical protein [Candidatus Promineifilaceae bacterium]